MRIFFIVITLLFISCNKNKGPQETFIDGLEEIIPAKLYVMHSMIYAKGSPWTTSNIFVIKGTGDSVWIFGSGYGDFNEPCEDACNDNNYYLGMEFSGTGPATEDVRPIDSIITNVFNLNKDSVILQFVVPHYHNDHINSEFIDAFFTTYHYPLKTGEQIWIHTNDSIGALCNEPCCGTQPCPDKKNKYYGVPYLPLWKPEYKNMFKTMGKPNDVCNTILKSFNSESGVWKITKAVSTSDKGHTDGTVNLQNENLKLEISGTKSKIQCDLPENWQRVSVHGNISIQ
ncbi:MAG: hypothetical protein IPI31_03585 [Bacteroidetes bacterium]|nr:hypothetical protein [Bacteroidota bacterium]